MKTIYSAIFHNVCGFESETHHNNKSCHIVGHHMDPNDTSVIDVECQPQFMIVFDETGEEYTAYPEEIDRKFWTPEMINYFADNGNGE